MKFGKHTADSVAADPVTMNNFMEFRAGDFMGDDADHPSIAVVIPCYNAERWVARAIESVLDQDYPHQELIVVDDGSTDDSLQIIQSFGEMIRWASGPNRGACAARNRGLEMTSADFMVFLDADDYIEGPLLEGLATAARRRRADLVIGRSVTQAQDGRRSSEHAYPIDSTASEAMLGWLSGRYVQTGGLMWRRRFLRAIGGWDERVKKHQDVEIVLRSLLHGARVSISDAGRAVWCAHASAHRMSMNNSEETMGSQIEFHDRLWRLAAVAMPSLKPQFAARYYAMARVAFFHGWPRSGQASLSRARALGFKGHTGGPLHSFLAGALGLRSKERLAWALKTVRDRLSYPRFCSRVRV